MPQQFDKCAEATSFGRAEAGRITGEILKRQLQIASPFRDRVEKEAWTLGVGHSNTYKTYNPRIFEAATDMEMTPWNGGPNPAGGTQPFGGFPNDNDGTGANGYPLTAACEVPLTEVGLMGEELRTFGLSVKGFKTPLFCAFDLASKHEANELLTAYYDTLAKNSNYFVERQIQNAYSAISENKIIANGQYPSGQINGTTLPRDTFGNTTMPTVAPASSLSQAMLDNIKIRLGWETSTMPNMLTTVGEVVFDLLTDDSTSTSLVQQNAGLLQSYQYAYEGDKNSPTIKGVGAYMGKVVSGFRHLFIKFPPRWDLVGGQWVRIRPYRVNVPADFQGRQSVTQEYLNAPFQDSFVFTTSVMKMVVQKPIPRVGPAVFGTPIKDYAGDDWNWFNTPGVQGCDLEGTKGFWWCIFRFGFKKVDPQCGYVIRHRRCDLPDSVYGCGSGFKYGTTYDNGYGYYG